MIMFFLPWWTYVLIGTIAFTCPFAAVWLAGIAFEKSASDDGPYPCLTHIGHDPELGTLWCWLVHGHDGDHQSQFRYEETVFTTLPPLPQRVSTLHNDPLKVRERIPCSATFSDPCPGDCWGETGCTRNT